MNQYQALDVFLYDEKIGSIVNIMDRNIFTFNESYIANPNRPTFSLSFKSYNGNLVQKVKSTQTRLPPFFANLLPEGALREYLAHQCETNPEREFFLLKVLGADLPGALTIQPASESINIPSHEEEDVSESMESTGVMRFSLAGVQLKFSAIWERGKRLTIPASGTGGAWIVKLPSRVYPGVGENEFIMMTLAREIGIEVPTIKLVPTEEIIGIPKGFGQLDSMAYAIQRFDRNAGGKKIHIEDFAQVFGVYPQKKYDAANYQNIAKVVWLESGEAGIIDFIRRLVFNALIGNGDMHLKNWSLIYPDKQHAILTPAYDYVSTIPYIPEDGLALSFVDSKKFTSLSLEQFERFASKVGIPRHIALDTALETIQRVKKSWGIVKELGLDPQVRSLIEEHMKRIPLFFG